MKDCVKCDSALATCTINQWTIPSCRLYCFLPELYIPCFFIFFYSLASTCMLKLSVSRLSELLWTFNMCHQWLLILYPFVSPPSHITYLPPTHTYTHTHMHTHSQAHTPCNILHKLTLLSCNCCCMSVGSSVDSGVVAWRTFISPSQLSRSVTRFLYADKEMSCFFLCFMAS